MPRTPRRPARLALVMLLLGLSVLFLLPRSSGAQMARPGGNNVGGLGRLTLLDPRFRAANATSPFAEVQSLLPEAVRDGWQQFLSAAGGEWQGYVDPRTNLLEAAEGSGIPWIPGAGNQLTAAGRVDLRTLEAIARAFLPRVAPMLGVDPAALVLSAGRSGHPADSLWLVDFDVRKGGTTIEGARVVFRVNNGNLVQFGTEGLPPLQLAAPQARVSRAAALAALTRYVGGFTAADTFVDAGSLHLLSAALTSPASAEGFEPGQGRGLALVWQLTFRRRGEIGTWRGRVDAETGQVTDFRDVNDYAKVNGGVYLDSFATGAETVRPMPFADVTPGGPANSAGLYIYPGAAVSSVLNGTYVQIFDECGGILQGGNGSGRISFGTSSGTDCATPGFGGTGNTHSARSQFYLLNRIKEIGRGWLPSNTWLNAQLTAVVNLSSTCNAYWDGTYVNFFHSGGGCGNTGEIAAVSMHEYGHGLDQNDGDDSSPDGGTRESYGDITAALVTHQSCEGNGFFLSGNCFGYGDACTSCSGVRDIDWAKHNSGTPHTVANFTAPLCPFGGGDDGPCGREAHCESYVISEAVWDLAARDLAPPGGNAAWANVERLWYETRSTTGSAFSCRPANVPMTSDGCSAGSLWRTFRAADDDDGNLANGTPHSCQIFAAFDRHGLACATDPGANVCFAACTPPTVPTVTLTSGAGGTAPLQLSWTSSGSGVVYDVYKSELGCNNGFIKVAAGLTGTSYLDSTVTDGLTYSYHVTARPPGNEACGAAPSACQSALVQAPACTPPAVPGGLLAQPSGMGGIRLTWNPVSGATDIVVLRATAPGGPYIQAADVAGTATTYTDTGLTEGTAYFYILRAAADECTSTASAEASASTQGCDPVTLYSNDFESGSGLSGWTIGSLDAGATGDWRGVQTCAAHSGSRIFRFGGAACTDFYTENQSAYAQPSAPIAVPAGVARTRLSFWHHWDLEFSFDGGWLIASIDGGSFAYVPNSALSGTGYTDGFIFTGTQTAFVNTVVDLDAVCNSALGGSGGCAGHSVVFAFNVSSDGFGDGAGWFLDDVTVTACGSHGCTGTPTLTAAAAAGPNAIQVSWANGSPASSSFRVYRAEGSCAAPGAFQRLGGAVAGSPFLDSTVSGGTAYAYRISGLDATGFCESNAGACVNATATGACTLAPTFGGLATVANAAQATCALDLSWTTGASRCAGAVTYNVYRSTDPGFVPGPGSLIGTGLTSTAFHDSGALSDSVPYTYIVRAVNPSSGQEDANLVRRTVSPGGPFASSVTLTDTFEGSASGGGFDLGQWSHAPGIGTADWTWSGDRSQSPSHSWYSPSQTTKSERFLMSPPFVPQAGSTLTFWHTYEFDQCYDGGTLEISVDGGTTWTVVPDAAFLEGGFTQTLFQGSPIGGKRGWCLGQLGTMTKVRLDLSGWTGQSARLRWHAGEDSVVALAGWYVDSVTLANVGATQACKTAPPAALDFYTVPPCRLLDTRSTNGPSGGPALQAGSLRLFPVSGVCGVPATAKAVTVNLTVTQTAGGGFLTLAPAGLPAPLSSSINFLTGQTRSNNAVLPLGDGTGAIQVKTATAGTVHLVVDVSGYFQ